MTDRRSKRVLIVDDNVEAAATLKEYLGLQGHEVVIAAEPVAALKAAEAFVPEVCILDIELPVMSGYELAANLRETRAKASVLISVTGYGQEHDSRRSRDAGFDHHLVKPVNLDRLAELIDASQQVARGS